MDSILAAMAKCRSHEVAKVGISLECIRGDLMPRLNAEGRGSHLKISKICGNAKAVAKWGAI